MTVAQIVTLLVRYGLVVLFFPASALDKIFNFKDAVKQAKQVFSSNTVAAALILVGVFVELVMPLGILTGSPPSSWPAIARSPRYCSSGSGSRAIAGRRARAKRAISSGIS